MLRADSTKDSLFETETLRGGDGKTMREQNVRVKGRHNQEGFPGGGDCEAQPGKGQMPLGEEWLLIKKE